MNVKTICTVLALGAIAVLLAGSSGGGGTGKKASQWAVPIELSPTGRSQVPLKGREVVLSAGATEGPRRIPVSLQATAYECLYRPANADDDGLRSRRFQCYELASERPYNWAFCWQGGPAPGDFHLFSAAPDSNVLTWTGRFKVYAAEVTQPVDRTIAIIRFLSGAPPKYTHVGGLPPVAIPGTQEQPTKTLATSKLDPFYASGPPKVKSAVLSKDGLRLVVCDSEERWFYTVAQRGGKWYTVDGDLSAPFR